MQIHVDRPPGHCGLGCERERDEHDKFAMSFIYVLYEDPYLEVSPSDLLFCSEVIDSIQTNGCSDKVQFYMFITRYSVAASFSLSDLVCCRRSRKL